MKHYLNRDKTLFLFIDMQDAIIKAMSGDKSIKKNNEILADAAELLDIDTIFTTQYKKGLGDVNKVLRNKRSKAIDIDKKSFSCMLNEEFKEIIKKINPESIVVTGIESHVCVLLTVRDLLKEGYEVYLVHDAVGSRIEKNSLFSIDEMKDMGAVIRSTESILFDLCSISGTPEFKSIQQLIK